MDDLKHNTQGPFTSAHHIFHASSRSSGYDNRGEGKYVSSGEKTLKCVVYTTSDCAAEGNTEARAGNRNRQLTSQETFKLVTGD